MTTIVITHDLSQVEFDDFVHVLKDGWLVEQGFRQELEGFDSEFRRMAHTQTAEGGFKEKDILSEESENTPVEAILERQDEEKLEQLDAVGVTALKHHSLAPSPLTFGHWMLDAIAELTQDDAATRRQTHRISRFVHIDAPNDDLKADDMRRKTLHIDIPPVAIPAPLATPASNHRLSLQFTPASPTVCEYPSPKGWTPTMVEDDDIFYAEKEAMQRSATSATQHRSPNQRSQRRAFPTAVVEKAEVPSENAPAPAQDAEVPFWRLMRDIFPTIPNKPLLFVGLCICLASGTMTPLFSFLLSRLFYEVSNGARDVSIINIYGGIVLAVAAADGIFLGLKVLVMENVAINWVTRLRRTCFARVLAQDKRWFDRSENAPAHLVNVLVKDGDDARTLIANVLCQFLVVLAMLGVGLIWALVRGWQLTLVGFAIAPVFAVTMALQSSVVAKCEVRNKRAREDVAKQYYDVSPFVNFFCVIFDIERGRRQSPTSALFAPWVSRMHSARSSTSRPTRHSPPVCAARSLRAARTVSPARSSTSPRRSSSTLAQSSSRTARTHTCR